MLRPAARPMMLNMPMPRRRRVAFWILAAVLAVAAAALTLEGFIRLDVRHVVLSVDKDGSLLVRRGLAPTDKVVAKPKPEAKTGDVVTIEPAGAKP